MRRFTRNWEGYGSDKGVTPLTFRKADFQLFREIMSGIPGETALRDKAVEQIWQILKEVFRRMQELMITKNKKSRRAGDWHG